jgi:Pentapeptide repeats (8 copies)
VAYLLLTLRREWKRQMAKQANGAMLTRSGLSYFWWSGAGAVVGGVWSAVLVVYAGLAPDRRLPGPTALLCSAHALAIVLGGALLGVASGTCLGRCLQVCPTLKKSVLGLALVFIMTMGVLGESGVLDALQLPDEAMRNEIAARRSKREWLERVSQPGADLTGAYLPEADLCGVKLSARQLVGACLTDADLRGADLRGADLGELESKELGMVSPTSLERADLQGADLRGANLCGVDLIGAKLMDAKLAGAHYSPHTSWPEGFDAQRHGAVFVR